jgi:hypothetical protein
MTSLRLGLTLLMLLLATPIAAQHGAAPSSESDARAREFDFLLGEWELAVEPKVSSLAAMLHGAPKLLGTWKAWRAFDGRGIEDELRIFDASGNPRGLTHSLRVFAPADSVWAIATVDATRARASTARAALRDDVMTVESTGVDAEGRSYRARSRYLEVTGEAFRMIQDRSFDDGTSWDEAVLTITATRVAANATR